MKLRFICGACKAPDKPPVLVSQPLNDTGYIASSAREVTRRLLS